MEINKSFHNDPTVFNHIILQDRLGFILVVCFLLASFPSDGNMCLAYISITMAVTNEKETFQFKSSQVIMKGSAKQTSDPQTSYTKMGDILSLYTFFLFMLLIIPFNKKNIYIRN